MSTFVEVDSVEKNCKVIINLDKVVEIAPLSAGGCAIFITDSAAVNGRTAITVKNTYNEFKQFAMQTVTSDDIAARIKNLPKVYTEGYPPNVPQDQRIAPEPRLPELEVKRGPGRPPKASIGTTSSALG